jgi:Domain of unknown function (DUF4402)
MRLRLMALVSLPLALMASAPAHAGQATGTVAADIVEPLTLTKTADLDFGTIVPGGTAGVVRVDVSGARTSTGGTTLAGGTVSAAAFAGFGRRNQQITISFGAPSIFITRGGGTETMVVDNFVFGTSAAGGLAPLGNGRDRISAVNGLFTFPVGADLHVSANQLAGVYSGSFTVTVIYQ